MLPHSISKIVCVSDKTVANRIKKSGIEYSPKNKLLTEEQIQDRVGEDFTYICGYSGCDSMITVRCKVCGTTFEKSFVSIRKGALIKCSACLSARKECVKDTRKRLRAQTKALHECFEIEKDLRVAVCKECGNYFNPSIENRAYCSDECRKRFNNNRKDRRLKGIVADYSITLSKVIKKENNICYLCGRDCDSGDYVINPNGIIVAGNNYPSIEHVTPLSKGGAHTWDNVRLAHRLCNTIKSAKI